MGKIKYIGLAEVCIQLSALVYHVSVEYGTSFLHHICKLLLLVQSAYIVYVQLVILFHSWSLSVSYSACLLLFHLRQADYVLGIIGLFVCLLTTLLT